MSAPIPPLNALRTFDAVARHGSLTRAAVELCVTHSAVSRQLAVLEGYLGITLFDRGARGVSLTAVGQAYFADISPVFEIIASATSRLRGIGDGQPLRLCVYATFAAKWLMHRLPRFEAAHPEIAIQISATPTPVDFKRLDIDAAIQIGDGQWSGIESQFLFADEIEPVYSPSLLRSGPPLLSVDDLTRHRLLQSRYRKRDWYDWLHGIGRFDLDARVSLQKGGFQNSLLAYQAAIEGLGIVIGQVRLLENDFAKGLLIRPFDRPVKRESAYYLLIPKGRSANRNMQAFRAWLNNEVSVMDAESPKSTQAS